MYLCFSDDLLCLSRGLHRAFIQDAISVARIFLSASCFIFDKNVSMNQISECDLHLWILSDFLICNPFIVILLFIASNLTLKFERGQEESY